MKFKLLILFVSFFVFGILLLSNSNFAFSQEDAMQAPLPSSPPPPRAIPQAGLQRPQALPPSPPGFPPTNTPPALLIRGKEFEMSRVLIENANVNKEVKIEFLMFDRDSKEKLTSKAYGLTSFPSAKYNVETSDTVKNSAQAVFTWTPTEKDIGTHGFAFEVSNSKGAVNRIAIFFDVKP